MNTSPAEALSALSGLQLLRLFQSNPELRPNIGVLLGAELETVDEGHIVFSIDVRPDHANPLGTVHGGIHATLLDSAMGCAVHSMLGPGIGYGTLEMKLNYLRTVQADAPSRLTATGRVLHLGRSTALAEGHVTDEAGKLIAHGTETCMIYR